MTAEYPEIVKKLVLVGSGSFEEKYVSKLHATRLGRLRDNERRELAAAVEALTDPASKNKDECLARVAELTSKTDTYDPIGRSDEEPAAIAYGGDIFQRLIEAAAEMRRSGKLLGLGKFIRCPVIAIHGDHDPHPAEGVRVPLTNVLKDFRFVQLKYCGHKPWIERQARDEFYRVLKAELL